MRNLKLIVSYVGTHYKGWQRADPLPSIEGALSQAIQTVLQQNKLFLQAASRTDRGVHAQGQVVNFFSDTPLSINHILKGLNGMLPKDIRIQSIENMPLDFHPTTHCIQKEYAYTISPQAVQSPFCRHIAWHFPYPLELALIQQAIPLLMGTHDFSSFSNHHCLPIQDPLCTLKSIEMDVREESLTFRLIGNRFLYKMVRNLVGTLMYIGCHKIPLKNVISILESRDRRQAGITAPAHGLCLKRIAYHPGDL